MEELNILIMVCVSFLGGTLVGGIATILIIKDNSSEITKELDKFRKLYFDEVDKFKNKYDQDDYEEY